jgi:outer membrane protein
MKSLLFWISLALVWTGGALAAEPVAAPAPTGPLDVDDAVRLALTKNYAYLRAEASVGVAEGNRLDAMAGMLPNAAGDYTYSKAKSNTTYNNLDLATIFIQGATPDDQQVLNVLTGSLSTDQTNTGSGFGLTVREDLSFSTWYRYRGAQAGVAQARHGRDAAAQDLAFQVRQQFYLVLRAQDLLKVQEEDLRLAQDQEKRTTSMFELGSVARVDVLKAKVRVSDAEVALIRQANQVDIERATLATLLGLGADTPIQLKGELKADVIPVDSTQAITESATRPDLLSAQENLRSASNLHHAATLSRIPGLFATFDANTGSGTSEGTQLTPVQIPQKPDPGDTATALVFAGSVPRSDVDFNNWQVRVGATVNLDAFLNTGQAKRTAGIKRQAEYDLKGLELDVQREVQQAVLNERASLKSIDAAQRGVESSEEDLRLSQERYSQGLGTVLELLEAQVNLTKARDSLVNALTVLKISEAALDKARGASLPY